MAYPPASDSRATSDGFTLPTNDDLINQGDDAIKNNAKISAGMGLQLSDRMDDVEAAQVTALLAAAWDGPILEQDTAPADHDALWIDSSSTARQWVDAPTGTANHSRQTATHATDGFTTVGVLNLRMLSGRVTGDTGTGTVPSIRLTDTTYGAQVTPGSTVTVAADFGGGAPGHATTYAPRVVWHDATGAIVSSETGSYAALTTAGARRSVTATVPAGIATATLHMVGAGTPTVAATIWITRISVTTDGSTEYVDGDTSGYHWTGAPGLSTTEGDGEGWAVVTNASDLVRPRPVAGKALLIYPEERAALDARARRLHARSSPRAQVALLVDDYPADTLNLWAPACASRGIPWSWAIPGGIFTPGHKYEQFVGSTTWDDLAALDPDVVELVNHSWSHDDVADVAQVWHEIIESRDTIRTQTGQDVLGWTPPGNDFPEGLRWRTAPLMANNGAELIYTNSTAGRLILAGHAWATDTLTRPGDGAVNTHPLDGAPRQLCSRVWVDNTAVDAAIVPGGRADVAVQTAIDRGHGVILSLHATHIEGGLAGTNKLTTAALGAWLDRLEALRDAGDIDLVLMTPWHYTTVTA